MAHMDREEAFQVSVSDSLRDTAVNLATVATRLEQTQETGERLAAGMERVHVRVDDHEKRIMSVERSVAQAAGVAKWFFGGGIVAACASTYFLFRLVEMIGAILKEAPR